MTPSPDPPSDDSIADVLHLLQKHRLLETVARRQDTPRSALLEEMQHRQNLVELRKRLQSRHPADLAHLLELLPGDDRELVWRELPTSLAGPTLVQLNVALRDIVVASTPRQWLLDMVRTLDADDLRYLAEALPADMLAEVSALLDARDQQWVADRLAYAEGSAGRLMTRDLISLRDDQTVGDALAVIRQHGALAPHLDRLFVVDARHQLRGSLGLGALIAADPSTPVSAAMEPGPQRFTPADDASDVAKAFERYDLLSAPVVDRRGRLVGRVAADAVVDFIRARSADDVLALAGLRTGEDLFAPVWDSARNRWPWLAVNLATAFVASRVIGAFERQIEQLVALAALMPIVASVGGNTGNQTVALVVRGLALDQIRSASAWHLLRKEITVGLLNGALWGSVVGAFAMVIYRSPALGAVMLGAVFMNLVIAALVGVLAPLLLHRLDRDPAQGASVMLTFATDGMGFLLFLGLATLFLL